MREHSRQSRISARELKALTVITLCPRGGIRISARELKERNDGAAYYGCAGLNLCKRIESKGLEAARIMTGDEPTNLCKRIESTVCNGIYCWLQYMRISARELKAPTWAARRWGK